MKTKKIVMMVSMLVMIMNMILPTVVLADDELSSIGVHGYNSEVGEIITNIGEFVTDDFTIAEQRWYNCTDAKLVADGDIFEYGKEYQYVLSLMPLNGYEFIEGCQIEIEEIEWDSKLTYVEENGCLKFIGYYTPGYEALPQIILYIEEELVAGSRPVYVSAPVNANYEITEQYWKDPEGNILGEDDSYELGVEYDYYISVLAKPGYRMVNEPMLVLGLEWDWACSSHHSPESGEFKAVFEGTYIARSYNVDFPSDINAEIIGNTVKLSGYSSEVGEFPIWAKNVENNNFTNIYETWYNRTENDGMFDQHYVDESNPFFDDYRFKKGNQYYYTIKLKANDGYEFESDAQIVIDDIDWDYSSSYVVDDPDSENYGCIIFVGYYTPGLEVIDSVSLTISEVKAGVNTAHAALTENANCSIAEEYWEDITNYNEETGFPVLSDNDKYDENTDYAYTLRLAPAEGYKFTGDTVIEVNGVEWNASYIFASEPWAYPNNGIFVGYYTTGLIENLEESTEAETEAPTREPETEAPATEPETEAETTAPSTEDETKAPETEAATTAPAATAPAATTSAAAPATGDASAASLYIVLIAVSLAGVSLLVTKRVRG